MKMRTRLFKGHRGQAYRTHFMAASVEQSTLPALTATPRNGTSCSSLADQLYQPSRTHCVWHVCILVPQAPQKAAHLSDAETAYWLLAFSSQRVQSTLHNVYAAHYRVPAAYFRTFLLYNSAMAKFSSLRVGKETNGCRPWVSCLVRALLTACRQHAIFPN